MIAATFIAVMTWVVIIGTPLFAITLVWACVQLVDKLLPGPYWHERNNPNRKDKT